MKLQPGFQLQTERGDGWDLGGPRELEQVHHVLLKILDVGGGLLRFHRVYRFFCRLLLLLFLIFFSSVACSAAFSSSTIASLSVFTCSCTVLSCWGVSTAVSPAIF